MPSHSNAVYKAASAFLAIATIIAIRESFTGHSNAKYMIFLTIPLMALFLTKSLRGKKDHITRTPLRKVR